MYIKIMYRKEIQSYFTQLNKRKFKEILSELVIVI